MSRQNLARNFGPTSIFNAPVGAPGRCRTNNNSLSTAFDQTPLSPSLRSPHYARSHHNKSLIFVPSEGPLRRHKNGTRQVDHGTEYLYGNLHREPKRQLLREPKRQSSLSHKRESDNYGSFATGTRNSVTKRTTEMFTQDNGRIIRTQQQEMNFAPYEFGWSSPYVGRTKTDVNENVNYDHRLYAKIRRFLEGSSEVISDSNQHYSSTIEKMSTKVEKITTIPFKPGKLRYTNSEIFRIGRH